MLTNNPIVTACYITYLYTACLHPFFADTTLCITCIIYNGTACFPDNITCIIYHTVCLPDIITCIEYHTVNSPDSIACPACIILHAAWLPTPSRASHPSYITMPALPTASHASHASYITMSALNSIQCLTCCNHCNEFLFTPHWTPLNIPSIFKTWEMFAAWTVPHIIGGAGSLARWNHRRKLLSTFWNVLLSFSLMFCNSCLWVLASHTIYTI